MTETAQLRDAVSRLSPPDRADLAAFLLNSLEGTPPWVSDEEVLQRKAEMDSGAVKGLTLAEFRAACGR